MQSPDAPGGGVADAPRGNWVDRFAPDWLKPYARLARWDRPIGFWLLFWPCGYALALATLATGAAAFDWPAFLLMLVGAVAMRGAGCTFNDIVDRDIDARVERTRSRPIASGRVSIRAALVFIGLQALIGLAVLVQFNATTFWVATASLVLIAIYPFMKRVTWWPQAFLGVVFSWGALVGWTSQTNELSLPALVLYAGCILWVIGYDTIYALQDVEDDALIGVRSTARLFGPRAPVMVALFYAGAVALWSGAALMAGAGPAYFAGLAVVVALLAWQVVTLDANKEGNALLRFKSNHWAGAALTLSILAAWLVP